MKNQIVSPDRSHCKWSAQEGENEHMPKDLTHIFLQEKELQIALLPRNCLFLPLLFRIAYSSWHRQEHSYLGHIDLLQCFFYLPSRIQRGGTREAENINVPSLLTFFVHFPWAWNGLNGTFVSHPPKINFAFFFIQYRYLESLSKNRQESDRWSGDESTSTQPFPLLVVEANGLAVDGTISMVHCHHLILLEVLVLTNACTY